jgi:predicted CopG family antitoxin
LKSIKVHDETHRALKRLKAKKRSRSIDQVIRELVRTSTGAQVEETAAEADRLTEHLD